MKERPILFSGPMVCALLAGTKTQTRRIMKPQPAEYIQSTPDVHPTTRTAPYIDAYCGERKTPENPRGMSREWHWWTADNRLGRHVARCPYGVPGDRLWVRETTSESEPCFLGGKAQPTVWYRADNNRPLWADRKWTPSILSPRRLSRITLEITGVRVERLWQISEADAKAEGCTTRTYRDGRGQEPATLAYRSLWQDINGSASWDDNPWVWVIEFKRLP